MAATLSYVLETEDINPKYARHYSRAAWKDSLWFKKHPQQSHRLRKPYPGELEYRKIANRVPPHKNDPQSHPGYVAYVVTVQTSPGERFRHIVYLFSGAPKNSVLAEAILHLQNTKENGSRFSYQETISAYRLFENPTST